VNDISFRETTPADCETIVEFQLAMALESEKMALDRARLERGVRGIWENPSRGKYFVAELEGRIAGCLLIQNEWSDWRCGNVWWIHSVYILPEFRRQKLFSQFYQFIQTRAAADPSVMGLRLYVDKTNLRAQKAYENLGMSSDHYHLYEWLKKY